MTRLWIRSVVISLICKVQMDACIHAYTTRRPTSDTLDFIVKAICMYQGKLYVGLTTNSKLYISRLCMKEEGRLLNFSSFLLWLFFDKFLIAVQQENFRIGWSVYRQRAQMTASPHLQLVLFIVIDSYFSMFQASFQGVVSRWRGGPVSVFRTINIDTCKPQSYYYV